jgi:general secretion pathway protein I
MAARSQPNRRTVAAARRLAWAVLRGFTLLEVLVAVAILGLGLTAILSAQFSAVAGVSHARYMSVAVGLARCKMSELEEQLRVDGFQEIDSEDSGPCCGDDDTRHISCTWRVEKPVFPEPDFGKLDLDSELESSALGALAGAATGQNPASSGDPSDITSALGGDLSALAAGGVGGIASMLMADVYPNLKPILEASTRRVTVVLTWTEGGRSYDMMVEQWVTQPQQGIDPNELPGEEPDSPPPGGSTPSPPPKGPPKGPPGGAGR